MVERQSNALYVCIRTRAWNSSLHKHTPSIHSLFSPSPSSSSSALDDVCKRAGVICFMMRRATCYAHIESIARSIIRRDCSP